MMKEEKGVTLVALIITIIVMLIIAGTTIATSNIIEKSTEQQILTNLTLIHAKVQIIMEKVSFNGETEGYYIGIPLGDGRYEYDQDTLNSIGLHGIKINGEKYIVNYTTGDIIYMKGDTVYNFLDMN